MYSHSHSPVQSTRSIHRDFGSVRSIHTAAANVSKTEEEEDMEMLVQHTTNRFSLIGKPREIHEITYLRTTWTTDDFKCWLSLTSDFRETLLRALEGTEVFTREAASLKRSNTILSPFVLAVARRKQRERQDKANYRRARLVELAHAKKLRAKAIEAQQLGDGGEEVSPCLQVNTSPTRTTAIPSAPPPFKEVSLNDNRLEDWLERLSCCTDWVIAVPADDSIPDTKTRKNIDRFLKWHLMAPITSTAKPGTWAHKALMTAERLKDLQNVRSVRDNIEMGGVGTIPVEEAVTTMRMMATERAFTEGAQGGGGRSVFGLRSKTTSDMPISTTTPLSDQRSPIRTTSHFLGGGSTLDDANVALNQPSRESIAFWVNQHHEAGRMRQESLASVGPGGFSSYYGKAESQISANGQSSAGGLTTTAAATRSGFTFSSAKHNASAASINSGTLPTSKTSKASLEMEKIQKFVDRQRNRYVSAMSPIRCGIDVYVRGEDGLMHGPGSRIGAGIKSDEEPSAATLTSQARFTTSSASSAYLTAQGSQAIADASSYPYEGELRLFGDGWGKKVALNRIPILKIEQIRLSSFLSPTTLRRFNVQRRRNAGVGGVTGKRYGEEEDEYADEDFDNNDKDDDDDGSPTITVLLIAKSFFVTKPVSLGATSYFGLRFDTSPKALSFISEVDNSGKLLQYLTDEVVKIITTWVNFDLSPPLDDEDGMEGEEPAGRFLRGPEVREYGDEDPAMTSPTDSDHHDDENHSHPPGMNFDFAGRVRAYSNAPANDTESRGGYGATRSRAASVISDTRSVLSYMRSKNISMATGAPLLANNNLGVAANLAPSKKKTVSVLLEQDRAALAAAALVVHHGGDSSASPLNRSFGSRSGASRSHLRSSFGGRSADGKSPRDNYHSPINNNDLIFSTDESSTSMSPSYFAPASPGANDSASSPLARTTSRNTINNKTTTNTTKSSANSTAKPPRTQRIKNFFLCRHNRTASGENSPLLGAVDVNVGSINNNSGNNENCGAKSHAGTRPSLAVAAKQVLASATTLVSGHPSPNANASSFGGADFSAFNHTATRQSAVLPYSTEIHPMYRDNSNSYLSPPNPPNSHVNTGGIGASGNMARDIAMELCAGAGGCGFAAPSLKLPPQPQPGSQVAAALTPRSHKEQVRKALKQMESIVRIIRSCTLNAQDRLQSNAISVRRQHFALSIAVETYLHAQLYALVFPEIKQMSQKEDERLDHVRDHFYEILVRQREQGGAAQAETSTRATGLLMEAPKESRETSPSGVSEAADSPNAHVNNTAHQPASLGATLVKEEEEAVIDPAYFGAAPSLKEFDPFIYHRLVAGINDNATSPLDKLQRIRALFLQVAEQAELVAAYNSYKARKEEKRNRKNYMTPNRGWGGGTTFSDEAQIIGDRSPSQHRPHTEGDYHREQSVLSSNCSTLDASFAAGFGAGSNKKEGICADDVVALLSLVLLACPCANLYSQVQYLVTFSSEATEEDSELEYAFVSFRVAVENLLQEEEKLNGSSKPLGGSSRAFVRTASTSSSSRHSGSN